MKLDEALNDFLLSCTADGLADATIKWYKSIVTAFVEANPETDLETVTTKQMRLYITELRSRNSRYIDAANKPEQPGGLAVHSIASHVRALHRFWSWCATEYDIPNPMAKIKRHKPTKKAPVYIKPKDFVRMFDECERSSRYPERDRALLAFLADTGCRVGGVVSLTEGNLDTEHCNALILEKGNHWRRVKFTRITARLLYQWLEKQEVKTDTIFGLKATGIYQAISKLKERAGVSGRVSPHIFRHTFIRTYLINGGDPFTLARLTGHHDVQTMFDFYALFGEGELQEMHDRHTPLNEIFGEEI